MASRNNPSREADKSYATWLHFAFQRAFGISV